MENNEENLLSNLCPFYVGQKAVCIKDHSIGVVKKGREYIVLAVFKGCCIDWIIDVGVRGFNGRLNTYCHECKRIVHLNKNVVSYKLFAPIQSQSFPLISLSRVIEKEKQLVCSN